MEFYNKWTNVQSANDHARDQWHKIIIVLLFIAVVIAKWPILDVPYHWDEMGAYFAPSWWLSKRSLLDVLPGRHPAGMFFGHPPLLYLLAAALFKQFGALPQVAHALAIWFAALGVVYTYRLGRMLVAPLIGSGAAILLMSFPLYFAQAGMLLGDIPITALGIMSVYYRLARKPAIYAVCALTMVLTKESSVLLVIVLLLFEFTAEARGARRWHLLLPHVVPLVALAGFFVLQKAATDSFLPNPFFKHDAFLELAPVKLLWKGAFACYWAFFAQWRFLLTGTILLAWMRMKRQCPRFFSLFAFISLAYVLAFTGIFFLPRYMLIVAPFVCLMAATSLYFLLGNPRRYFIGIAAPVLLAIMVPPYKQSGFDSFETSMQYLDLVKTNKEAAAIMVKDHVGKTVLAPWPLTAIFSEPAYGYVQEPLAVTMDSTACWDFVAVSPQGDQAVDRSLRQVIAEQQLLRLHIFSHNGKKVEVYRRQVVPGQCIKVGF